MFCIVMCSLYAFLLQIFRFDNLKYFELIFIYSSKKRFEFRGLKSKNIKKSEIAIL